MVERSEDVRVRDEFGKLRLREGRYTPGEIDRAWSEPIEADCREWMAARWRSSALNANSGGAAT